MLFLDVGRLVGDDGVELAHGQALDEGVGEEDVAERGDEADDGAVEHGAAGAPDEDRPEADAVVRAERGDAVAELAVSERRRAPDDADQQRGDDEHGDGHGELGERDRGAGGVARPDHAGLGQPLGGADHHLRPGDDDPDHDEPDAEEVAGAVGDDLAGGGRGVDGLAQVERAHDGRLDEAALDGGEGPPAGDEGREERGRGEGLVDQHEVAHGAPDGREPAEGDEGDAGVEEEVEAEAPGGALGAAEGGGVARAVEPAARVPDEGVGEEPRGGEGGEGPRGGRPGGPGRSPPGVGHRDEQGERDQQGMGHAERVRPVGAGPFFQRVGGLDWPL